MVSSLISFRSISLYCAVTLCVCVLSVNVSLNDSERAAYKAVANDTSPPRVLLAQSFGSRTCIGRPRQARGHCAPRSYSAMADFPDVSWSQEWPETWHELESRQTSASTVAALAELSQFNNMSGRQYDQYVFSLDYKTTGCYQRGALPIPLNANGSCLPGWHCEL